VIFKDKGRLGALIWSKCGLPSVETVEIRQENREERQGRRVLGIGKQAATIRTRTFNGRV
jgi:hypothetical protein